MNPQRTACMWILILSTLDHFIQGLTSNGHLISRYRFGVLYSADKQRCFSTHIVQSVFSHTEHRPAVEIVWRLLNHSSSVTISKDDIDQSSELKQMKALKPPIIRVNIHIFPEIPFSSNRHRHLLAGQADLWIGFIINVIKKQDLLQKNPFWFIPSDPTSATDLGTCRLHAARDCNVVLITERWRECLQSEWTTNTSHSKTVSKPDGITTKAEFIYRESIRDCHLDFMMFSLCYNNSTAPVKTGKWNRRQSLRVHKRSLFTKKFYKFDKEYIVVAATEALPFVSTVKEEGKLRYVGFSIDILDELAKHLLFNYSIIEPPDGFFGAPTENGTWNGMIGMVKRGEADMAVGPFSITSLREQVVDFTVPFSEGSTGIITLSPGYQANKSLFQTFKPYSVLVWISVLSAIAVVSITSFFINRFTPIQRKIQDRPIQATYETSLEDNMWMVYSSVTEQGIQHGPIAVSGRCLIGFWWLFTILLVATYTANLAAFLTISLPPPPINTLGELLAQDKIQPIVQAGTSFETLFKNSKSGLYRETWGRMKDTSKISHEPSILKLVKEGKYAYISDRPVLDYLAGQECNVFSVAEERFDVVGYGIVLPEGAPYKKIIDGLIVKMQEAGLMDKWKRHWWSSNDTCQRDSQSLHTSLGLDSLGGLFLFYLGIATLALLACLGEIINNNRSSKTNNTRFQAPM